MKLHIMLVDDDKDELSFFLDALRQVLSEDEYKCTYASNAIQANEMLKYLEPDFIFVDFKMPDVNGLQFLSTIKSRLRSQNQKLKTYLYSIFCNEEINMTAISLGATGTIKKMYTINELANELKAIFIPPVTLEYVFSGADHQKGK